MYKYFEVEGNNKLSGEIKISGAKNSVLPVLISTVLVDGKVTLTNVPNIEDVKIIISILERLGSKIKFDAKKAILKVDNTNLEYKDLLYEDVSKLRASYYFLGAMIGKFKKVKILLPGGCFLGPRPIDLHIKGFKVLGCDVTQYQEGNSEILEISLINEKIESDTIFLDIPSVGATINLLFAAAKGDGVTIIENAAKEPEITDVVNILKSMGVKIEGAESSILKITGTSKFKECTHEIIPDRIEAGTYVMFGVLLGENLKISNINVEHLEYLFAKLKEANISFEIGKDYVVIKEATKNIYPINIKTGVYPSFPTDLQQVMVTLLTQADGESMIEDRIYPDRFRNCKYLNKMGSNITIINNDLVGKAKIEGKTDLTGEEVIATDLRGGASLIFAGLLAKGTTKIDDINHILRGYNDIVNKLSNVGAKIKIVESIDNE